MVGSFAACLAEAATDEVTARTTAGSFVQGLVDQGIGIAILFAVDMVDAEVFETLRHFLGAFKERP